MSKGQRNFPNPSIEDIRKAREEFEKREPRDLFYRVALELMDLATQGKTRFRVVDALAVLLQTWNKRYYNTRPFDSKHFSDIENLINCHKQLIEGFRRRSITSFSHKDEGSVKAVFKKFDEVVGPVGAAKSLHLLAPLFFPIWDSVIAAKYGLSLKYGPDARKHDINAERYYCFMEITKTQYNALIGEAIEGNLLKAIDEYNYCKLSRGWMID